MRLQALLALERAVTRRSFLGGLVKATALAASVSRLQPQAFAIDRPTEEERHTALEVYSQIGNLTIPVDEDPGWATFEPEISEYGLNVFIGQVFLKGERDPFDGFLDALNHLNEVPHRLSYNLRFLEMSPGSQNKYLTDILTGQFEQDGWQDILSLAAGFGVVSCKATFFSNFPRHLAEPGAEFQVRPPSEVKTGWDIMRLKGPVGPQEEEALRERFFDIEEIPGIDFRNPYI